MKYSLPGILLVTSFYAASAQHTTTTGYLDINQIKAAHMVHGDMWRDIVTSAPSLEFPKGTGKHASYLGGLWMSGKDNLGNIHTSAVLYRIPGLEFYPGPLDLSTGAITAATSEDWSRIWKINSTDIGDFLGLSSRTLSTVPADILEWPAKGNPYAKGYLGAELIIDRDMAPFVDADGDGSYNALKGDYPKIKGDQMLWWVINDNGPFHTESYGLPFSIECHISAYAYKRGGAADRILFYEYDVLNRSGRDYTDFRLGLFSDADLGYAIDDYIAFDSSHRMGITYNGSPMDRDGKGNTYGPHPPVTGLSFLEVPGDSYPGAMHPLGCFNYFEGIGSGDPHYMDPGRDTQFYHTMRGRGSDGKPRYFGNYAFPITGGAIQCDSNYPKTDRRYMIATDDHIFTGGSRIKLAMAFMTTDTTGNTCPGIDFGPITQLADSAWKIYYNPLPSLSVKERNLVNLGLKIWPNPATDQVYISRPLTSGELAVTVYDQLGRCVAVPVAKNAALITLDISALPAGIYALHCSNSSGHYSETLLKK